LDREGLASLLVQTSVAALNSYSAKGYPLKQGEQKGKNPHL